MSFSYFWSFPAPVRVRVRPWGLAQDCAARAAPSDARQLSMLVTTTMPLVPTPDTCFAPKGLSGLLPFLPQVHPADVLQGPPSHQHHHHLPQRGPLHPAQDHPQVSCPSWSVSPPGPALGEGLFACWAYWPCDEGIRCYQSLPGPFITLPVHPLSLSSHPCEGGYSPILQGKDRGLRCWVICRRSLSIVEILAEPLPLTPE